MKRRWGRKILHTAVPFVILVLSLASWGAVGAQESRPDIRVRHYSRPRQLDPAFYSGAADYFIYYNIFNHLVRWKPGSVELEPDLAERWEVSQDGRVWTFFLQKGVQFHKGYGELTAHDAKFSFDRFLDTALESPHAGDYLNVERVEVVDRYTVRFVLRKPSAVFIATTISSRPSVIVSKKAVEEKGKAFTRDPVGTGPFVFQRWTVADEVTLTANDRYFKGAPKVAKLTFVPIADETVAVAALERGEIHILGTRTSVEAVRLLRTNPAITLDMRLRPSVIGHLAINPQYPPLKDLRVRRALAYAINRKELELATEGLLPAANHLLPDLPYLREAELTGKFPLYPYDPARAKRLLTEAGFPALKVALTYSIDTIGILQGQVLAEQFRRAGIDPQMEGLENRAFAARWETAQFQLLVTRFARGFDPHETARELLHTSNFPPGHNVFRYDQADRLIDAGSQERDPRRRQAVYIALLKKVMADVPYIPLHREILVAAWRAPIKRMVTGLDGEFPAYTIEVTVP